MGRSKVLVSEAVLAQARVALQELPESKLAIQLKAILASGTRTVEEVSDVMCYGPRTIARWIHNFALKGIDGLRDKSKGHLPAKLNAAAKAQVEQWIRSGKNNQGEATHWTLKKLRIELKNQMELSIGTTALWNHLQQQQLVLKCPRPVHVKANPVAQEEFKKNERNNQHRRRQG
jgi:transposase